MESWQNANKALPVHYLTADIADSVLPSASAGETFFIEDGIALLHALKDVPSTCKNVFLKVLDSSVCKPDVFSTDMYFKDHQKPREGTL